MGNSHKSASLTIPGSAKVVVPIGAIVAKSQNQVGSPWALAALEMPDSTHPTITDGSRGGAIGQDDISQSTRRISIAQVSPSEPAYRWLHGGERN